MRSSDTVAIVVGAAFAVLFLAERIAPLRAHRRTLRGLFVNGSLSLIVLLVSFVSVRPVATALLGHASLGGWAWHWLPLPLSWGVQFLLMDVSFYYWHRLNHTLPWLWRAHVVHHADPVLDVSTGFRFHAAEVAYSAVFRAVQILVIGVSLEVFVAYELVFQVATLFHHSNWRLPIRVERALNRVFVTPRMHGIHHSHARNETHSNYSVVFSWWDRLHRSLVLGVAQQHLTIGTHGYSSSEGTRLLRMLAAPFRTQPRYFARAWTTSPAERGTSLKP